MSVATSLIPGLDEIVRQGDPRRLADAVRRIAELLVQGAATFRPDHVDLFDRVLIDLVPHTGIASMAANAGALFSRSGYPMLIRRAGADGVLTLKLGQRQDLPDRLLKELLAGSIEVVRRRLFEMATPERAGFLESVGDLLRSRSQ